MNSSVEHSRFRVGRLSGVLVVLFAAGAAVAQSPRLARPGDAESDAVRVAASDFYSRVAAGDVAGARQLMSGSSQAGRVVESLQLSVTALDRMVSSLAAKFGNSEVIKPWLEAGAAYKRRQATEARQKLVFVAGDEAVLAGSAFADPPIRFRREGGAWKIVAVTPMGDPEEPYIALNNRLAAAAATVRTRVETGGFYRIEPSLQEFARLSDEAMTEFGKAMDAAPDAVIAPAAIGQLPSGDALAALLGKSMESGEVAGFIASLNTLGEVMSSPEGTAVAFPAAGVGLEVEKGGAVVGMTLHDQGDVEFAKYPGPLPAGLLFGARRAIVQQVVGTPVWSLGEEELAADFPNRGLTLTFAGKGSRDGDAGLRRVNVAAVHADASGALQGLTLQFVAGGNESPVVDVPYLSPAAGSAPSLRLQTVPLVTEVGVSRILPNFNPETGNWGVEITFTAEAGKSLTTATTAAKGRTLAIVAGGKIVATLPIDSPLGERVVINLGNQVAPTAARGLAGQLHAAAFVLK